MARTTRIRTYMCQSMTIMAIIEENAHILLPVGDAAGLGGLDSTESNNLSTSIIERKLLDVLKVDKMLLVLFNARSRFGRLQDVEGSTDAGQA